MTATAVEPEIEGAVVAPGTALAPYAAGTVEEYRPRIVMSPDDAKALDDQLRECMKAILREGVDYGPIPGGDKDKKNLLKPGAEKLLQWYGYGSRSIEVKIERDDPEYPSGIADRARRIGVTYRTEVTKTLADGREVVVATCEGYAGYEEDRYYQPAEQARAKAESKERFYAEKDQRPPNPRKWEFITDDYRAPWNTLIKMAQKRSYVGAAIDATSAAGLFTQDMEDMGGAEPQAVISPVAAIAEAGRGVIAGLPKHARDELDRWFRTQGWPGPAKWDVEQWCAGLVQAGKLSAAPAGGQSLEGAIVSPLDPADPWAARVEELASPAEAEDLAREVTTAMGSGDLAEAKGNAVLAAIIAYQRKAAA